VGLLQESSVKDHTSCSGDGERTRRGTGLSAGRTAAIGLAALLAGTTGVQATEGGGGHYPNGAEDFMSGALPPPGTYLLAYVSYYGADRFNDGDGNKFFPDFDLDVTATTLRFIHVTGHQILGASWAVHAFLPLVNVDVSARPPFPGAPLLSDDKLGIGDIIIDPIILGWHSKNWHFIAGLDIYVPTGAYDEDDLANIGRNYWTLEPVAAFTYLSDNGFEVSAKFMYDFNTENDDTDYQSGQELHFDYTVAYHTGPWAFGLGGYYYQQTTDDEVDGDKVGSDGFKGKAIAFGPQVQYGYKNMSFTLKYQTETEVEYRPEGDALWFKFLYVF
jgi:hypothetical protein